MEYLCEDEEDNQQHVQVAGLATGCCVQHLQQRQQQHLQVTARREILKILTRPTCK